MQWDDPFLAGAVGSTVAAVKFAPGASLTERAINAAAGCAAAGYLAPALAAWLRKPEYVGGAAFLLGLVSMSLAAAALDAIKQTQWAAILTGWLSRK